MSKIIEDTAYFDFFKQECNFVKGVVNVKNLPSGNIPEVAFWGRSNAGKSSILNALTSRVKLARISKTPGRTREINFFIINNLLHLVDLPGYGYAKVMESQKNQWNQLILDYIIQGRNLKRLFLLIDAKVGFKTIDYEIMDFLNLYGKSYQIVITKSDRVSNSSLDLIVSEANGIANSFPSCFPETIITSSKKKKGINDIKINIYNLLNNIC